MMELTRRGVLSGASTATLLAGAVNAVPMTLAEPDATIMAMLARLDALPHLRSGSAHEMALAALLQTELQALGFKVERQLIDVPWFEERAARIAWSGGAVDIVPQRRVTPSGPGGISAPLRLWHSGADPVAARGAIVLVRLPPRRHSQLATQPIRSLLEPVMRSGPAAVVLITDGPTGETIWLNAPYDQPMVPVPLATLGPVPGRELLQFAEQGGTARITIDGTAETRRSPNLVAIRPGKGPAVVVSTPRTGWTPAVAERGPGLAAFLLLARWAVTALPGRTLLFLNTTAHEYDNEGGRQFFESRLAPSPADVALWAHLGAGFAGRAAHEIGEHRLLPLPSVDPQRFLIGSERLVPLLRKAFAGQPGLEAAYPARAGAAGELGEILAAGHTNVFGLFGAHLRHHLMSDRMGGSDPAWIKAATGSVAAAIQAAIDPEVA